MTSRIEKRIIVIIGGPGTGKTTLLEGLIAKGYCCYPEISREITKEAKAQGTSSLFIEKPLLFSELLLEGRIKQFQAAQSEKQDLVFIDRGIPDILAYLNYLEKPYPISFDTACKEHRYTTLFILPPWPEIYTQDTERYEDFEQAKAIQNYIIKTYTHLGYSLIEVPKNNPEKRIQFILDSLSQS